MGEFEEKLNAILSNPDALAQVANLAQSLNLGGGSENGDGAAAEGGAEPDLGGLSGLGDLLGQIDPGLLTGNGGSDERLQLLYALRPFLKPERRDKVERAVKTARLIHVGKKLLKDLGESYV